MLHKVGPETAIIDIGQLIVTVCLTIFYHVQCASLPDTSYPTGTARSFQSFAAALLWMIRPFTTQWCALPGRRSVLHSRSRRSQTCTAGHTSCWCQMTSLQEYATTERCLLKRSSRTTKTTLSRG